MGGMEEMGLFYDDCLEELYPPGICGTFCNEHTYDCYLDAVHQACCDEGGTNCVEFSDVPLTCPVGCAIVFPEFLETCRDHVSEHAATDTTMDLDDFEAFETDCLDSDGLALVEYALDMVAHGCTLDLNGAHRRLQKFLGTWLGSTTRRCSWDEVDDYAGDVDMMCCGADGVNCGADGSPPASCTPACAVSLHQFIATCGDMIMNTLSPDERYQTIMAFEQTCLDSADPMFFLHAIQNAQCPNSEATSSGYYGRVDPVGGR
eukprot:COSAG02_NODE_413_length_22830_cov_57.043597_2_plen_261_part_00